MFRLPTVSIPFSSSLFVLAVCSLERVVVVEAWTKLTQDHFFF